MMLIKVLAGIAFVFLLPFYAEQLLRAITALIKCSRCLPFSLSLLASSILSALYIKRNSFFLTFEHELTHLIFSLLTLSKVKAFYSGEGRGFVKITRSNFLVSLAPYFFPTLSFFLLPLKLLIKPSLAWLFSALLGASFGYHIASNFKEINPSQPDLRQHGILFSLLAVAFFQIFFYGAIIDFVLKGWDGIIDFWYTGAKRAVGVIWR